MKRYLIATLILLAIGTSSFGQKIAYNKPDFILHIAPEDSNDGFGWPRYFGRFNNDKYEDLVVIAPHFHNSKGEKVGKAYIYYGTRNGIDTVSYLSVEGICPVVDIGTNEWDNRGLHSAAVGDFNNDGYHDLAVGTPWFQRISDNSSFARGYAMVFLSNGDGSGLNLSEHIDFWGYTPIGNFSVSMNPGDVNGDRIQDLIISARYDEGYYEGRIYIYYGSEQFDNIHDKVLKSSSGRTGLWCRAVGDLNGDFFDDVIGWDKDLDGLQNLQYHVWFGGQDMNQSPKQSRLAPFNTECNVKDLNNDSFADIVISDIYWHNPPQILPNLTVIKGDSTFDINDELEIFLTGYDSRLFSVEDINNNGINDACIEVWNESGLATSYILPCDETNFIDIVDTLFQFRDSDSSYGSSVWGITPADMNGDGEFEFYADSRMAPYKNVIFIYNANFPSLSISHPNAAGMELKTGKEYTICWESKGNVGPFVKLELYKANSLHRIISESTDNDGSHKWTISPELQTGSDFRIKISSVTDSNIYDFSNHFFTIKQVPNLKITHPDSAGIIWYWGATYKIQWQSWGQVGPNVKLELYRDNLFFKTINFSAVNEGYYQKSISSEETSGENFKIKITAVSNDSVYDFSDHAFAIFPAVNVEESPAVIYSNKLYPNYPNPFNTNTTIRYVISQTSDVQIRIYNLLGKIVKTLVNKHQSPGAYELNWDGKDDETRLVAGGIYILELKTEKLIERKKITFLK
ncbi:MAG: FG-GAP repeat protein [bacterium]|nr:MAG: FG-GAP repeat protein [bacterium]